MSAQSEKSEAFKQGLKIRRQVLGDVYVNKALAGGSDAFGQVGQEYVTEVCWASWGRPGVPELKAHIRGAINNGLTEQEISEAIRHTMIYAGVLAGVDAFKVAGGVIRDMKESGEYMPPATQ